MHGQGNDFVVLNGIAATIRLTQQQLAFLADRHRGVGCDQILLVEACNDPGIDFRYRIFNADGQEVEQCGNGARCFAQFVRDEGLTGKDSIRVRTMNGVIAPRMLSDGRVQVDMGPPRFEPREIPFVAAQRALRYDLEVDGEHLEVGVVSMGNPHAVQRVDDVERAAVASLGPKIERHARFPQRVNAGFMQVVERDHIRLRVYERGVGETLACGSGACAAVVIGIIWGLLDPTVTVSTRGGDLSVTWQYKTDGESAAVCMTGTATSVFRGEIEI